MKIMVHCAAALGAHGDRPSSADFTAGHHRTAESYACWPWWDSGFDHPDGSTKTVQ